MNDANSKRHLSHSVLGTSSNLLGICFVILGYIKKGGFANATYLDELLIFPIVGFFGAAFLSYLALRSEGSPKSFRFERWADLLFMIGLSVMTLLAFALIFEFYV